MSRSLQECLLLPHGQPPKFHPYPFWTPRFWNGMRSRDWWRLVSRHRFDIHPTRWGMFCAVTGCTLVNSSLCRLQNLLYGRRMAATTVHESPVFIIGHWRSGTTYLHELLSLDPRFVSPTTYQCFVPHHFLISQWILSRVLWIPARRPMDNVRLGWNQPQEDEFALCIMGVPSPYARLAFPNHPAEYLEYLDMVGVGEADLQQWKHALLRFTRLLSFRSNKRLLLKSPTHTGRMKVLLELFPHAKFLHIVRDPFTLIPSTVRLWQSLETVQALQRPRFEQLVEYVFEAFQRMYRGFDAAQGLVAPSQLHTVQYERLVDDPLGEVAKIYERLELGDLDAVRSSLDEYIRSAKQYQTNQYPLPTVVRDEIARRCGDYIQRYGYCAQPAAQ